MTDLTENDMKMARELFGETLAKQFLTLAKDLAEKSDKRQKEVDRALTQINTKLDVLVQMRLTTPIVPSPGMGEKYWKDIWNRPQTLEEPHPHFDRVNKEILNELEKEVK